MAKIRTVIAIALSGTGVRFAARTATGLGVTFLRAAVLSTAAIGLLPILAAAVALGHLSHPAPEGHR